MSKKFSKNTQSTQVVYSAKTQIIFNWLSVVVSIFVIALIATSYYFKDMIEIKIALVSLFVLFCICALINSYYQNQGLKSNVLKYFKIYIAPLVFIVGLLYCAPLVLNYKFDVLASDSTEYGIKNECIKKGFDGITVAYEDNATYIKCKTLNPFEMYYKIPQYKTKLNQ